MISSDSVTIAEPVLPSWLAACQNSEVADDHLMYAAYDFAREHHIGQFRKSGEPYISHPIAVADILYNLGGAPEMIAAGFLHDIVEDVEEITAEDIEKLFGAETKQLVEGVTKLSKFNFSSKKEQQAENFRRMFLAMAQDIRVIVVKLADRLHNMQTLEHMSEAKQLQIAQETRDIFAPLANRLGLGRIKWELEDLAFKYIEPQDYRRIQDLVKETRAARENNITNTIERLRHRLQESGIKYFEVSGRPKHLYSIYQKMSRQKKDFSEIFDLTAVRIIVNTKTDCYHALAEVHDAFKPIPGRFKDYIGLPKPNRYQSLHTTVLGIANSPVEIQIRTLEMHRVAEYGIAAHWKYKEASNGQQADEKFTWLRQLLEWQNDVQDAQEYLQSVKGNLTDQLLDHDVYVFTPKGEVISLRQGATTIDFAYRIHTEVGNHCAGAKINGRMVPLHTPVRNGDIVEVMTKESSHPSLDWLNFVATTAAKNRITQWYKRSHREENVARGREMLEKELGKSGLDALLKSEPLQGVAQRCNYQTAEDLLAGMGYGEVTLNHVVNRIREAVKTTVAEDVAELLLPKKVNPATPDGDFPILGIEGLLQHLAGCCNPIPNEPIIGVVTRLNGISVHRQGCPNLDNIDGDRIIPVSWNTTKQSGSQRSYIVSLQVEVVDRVGVLKDVLSRLSDNKVNVRQAKVIADNKSKPVMLDLCVEVVDKSQLERCISQIKQMHDVLNVRRLVQME
jgi:GTP diphosphokinase / guanosine-3',5'-bis(diphosphate) 3'-diphosphatase